MQNQIFQNQMQLINQNQFMQQQQNLYNKKKVHEGPGLSVIFRKSGNFYPPPPVTIQCWPEEKVSEIIEIYRNKSGYFGRNKFIFMLFME